MAVEYSRKCCATCELWQGARNLSASKKIVIADGLAKGNCMQTKKTMLGNYGGCMKYEKWALIKT